MHQEPATSVHKPATKLEEFWKIFDHTLEIDPTSSFYIPRTEESGLKQLVIDLKRPKKFFTAFLCGHMGSGKTTELDRICADVEITATYLPVYLSVKDFGIDIVQLTHDAILLEIGLSLAKQCAENGLGDSYKEDLEKWGIEIVKTFSKDERIQTEAGAKGNAFLAFFKASLSSRREWKSEQKQILKPRVQDLIGILNLMAQSLENKVGKKILVIVDDLEKGDSDAHKEMHERVFQENYEALTHLRFTTIYTLPIYFRASPGRISNDEIYAFSSVRLYQDAEKFRDHPALDQQSSGYQLMRKFIESRVTTLDTLFEAEALDELLLIGGGLFRDTARAVGRAADFAVARGSQRIGMQDTLKVFNQLKKEYQPSIRGEAVTILKAVLASEKGWVVGVEPFLQSRAVVEYENGDLWIDVRYVLKPFVRSLGTNL